MLEAYTDKGGALIILEQIPPLSSLSTAPIPLADLLAKWGISIDDDIVVDPTSATPPFVFADTQNYGQHPITAKLRGFNQPFLPGRSIHLGTAPDGVILTALAQTDPSAWGETDLKSTTASFDPTVDVKGPLVLAAAAENSTTKGRLVVFGDSAFAADLYYKQGTGGILINAIDWAANQQDLIGLTPKNNIARTFNPPDTLGLIGIVLSSICLIPLLVIGAGLGAWYTRRRRG